MKEGGDEDAGPVATRHESFGIKLAHQFPWLGSASVAVGLALRRRFLSDPDAPSTSVRRKQIVGVKLCLVDNADHKHILSGFIFPDKPEGGLDASA